MLMCTYHVEASDWQRIFLSQTKFHGYNKISNLYFKVRKKSIMFSVRDKIRSV